MSGGLTQPQLQDWVRGYLGEIYQRTGVRGVIYMSPAFWVKYAGDTTWFADNGYKVLWIAHWTTATAPTLPADAWGGNGWSFWQYTSQRERSRGSPAASTWTDSTGRTSRGCASTKPGLGGSIRPLGEVA